MIRLVFGTAMAASVVLAVAECGAATSLPTARMTRGYAIGLWAWTQVPTHLLPWFVLADGAPGKLPRAVMMGAGWVTNVLAAGWIIRRGSSRPSSVPAPVALATSPSGR